MVEEDGRVPLIDIGTLARIRDGSIRIRGAIDRFVPDGVGFADATVEKFDAVILATGFQPDLRRLIPDVEGVFDRRGMPLQTGRATDAPGLYFCGQTTSPTGQLREIGLEAQRIAESARRYMAAAR
jgi:thioredoxin reductase